MPPTPGADHGGAAGHGLQVDDAQRLVQRRAREHRRVAEDLDDLGLGQHAGDPDHAGPGRPQVLDQPGTPRLPARACPPARRTAPAGPPGSSRCAARSSTGSPFCRVTRPTNTTDGRAGSMPYRASTAGAGVGGVLHRVDPVADDVHSPGPDRRVGAQDVGPHAVRDRDDRGRRLDGRPLAPATTARSRRPAARPSTAAAAPASARSSRAACRSSWLARKPARLAYQVCECTRSAPTAAAAMDRSAEMVCERAVRGGQCRHGRCATAPGRSAPWQCTVRSTSLPSSRARYSTCTPAPP